MRSFYGSDRLDNAYFISENFSESLLERDFLFAQHNLISSLPLAGEPKRAIKARPSATSASGNILGLQSH